MDDPDNNPRNPVPVSPRYGRKMMFAAWLALFALLYVFFGETLENIYNPNQTPKVILNADGSTDIVLQQNRYGHYMTGGKINDIPVNFMLDTGATDISIPMSVAKKIGLRGDVPVRVQTANGIAIVYRTKLAEVSIGDINLHDVRANINPNMGGSDVLLGMSFLKHLDFSQSNRQLTIRQQASSR